MMQEQHVQDRILWPEKARVAVILFFDFQGGEGVRLLPEGNVYFEDFAEAEYGPKTGIWRILRILEEQGIVTTFLTCGAIAERYPETVEAIVSKGHEVSGHGYHHEVARDMPREEEKEVIQRATDKIRVISGKRPVGWRSCTQSPNTLEILMEEGYLWNSNSFSYDLPFIWMDGSRRLVELPRQPFGDGRIYRHGGSPYDALAVWKAAFDELYAESEVSPAFCPFTFHPYISSRLGRGKVLAELTQYIRKHEGVWFATGSEVARWCLDRIID
jgi:peptidoglycan/xylan/chitin deacetylase (PgdA/CDA1 family)